MSQANDDFDVDALLDGTLDDLADMPEFKPYPAGGYKVIATLVDKTGKKDRVNGHPGYELKMKIAEVIEVSDANETPPNPGDESSVLFLIDNEMGQGALKKVLIAAAATFGAKTNRELIADIKEVEAMVITKQRKNKDKTQTYTDIVEIQFS